MFYEVYSNELVCDLIATFLIPPKYDLQFVLQHFVCLSHFPFVLSLMLLLSNVVSYQKKEKEKEKEKKRLDSCTFC